MTRFQAFRHVVLRPALQKIWPALTSQLVLVMFGSAVCSQIAVEELTYAASFVQSRNFRAFESYLVATVLYLVLALLLRQAMRGLGAWLVFAGPRR
jgi:polar amino acid transport system permease protein